MKIPSIDDQTRSDLRLTGNIFDSAANSSVDSTMRENLQGTEAAKGLLAPDQNFEQSVATPGDSAMSEAVRNKFMRGYNDQDQAFQHQQKLFAVQQHAEKVQHTAQLVNQEQQMNFEKAMEKYKQDKARKAARSALVGQVLGVVGGAVAGYFTAGAATGAGYAAGTALGQAVGGND